MVASGVRRRAPARLGEVDRLTRVDCSPEAPFAAVEVEVERQAGTVVAGLSTPDGDHVVATHSAADRTAAIEVRVAGRSRVVRRRRVDLRAPFTLGFVLCENQVTVLARSAGGTWRPLLTERRKVAARLDLRRPETLGRFGYTWGARSGSATLGEVRAGLHGMSGLRDPHVVQHADGRPFVRDGKAYLTWTCAGLGSFRQAHWGVFTLDLATPPAWSRWRSCSPAATACCSATTPASWCATGTAGWWRPRRGATSTTAPACTCGTSAPEPTCSPACTCWTPSRRTCPRRTTPGTPA